MSGPELPYTGRLVAGRHVFALRIYFEDTDAGGVVYHANYLRYLERARSDLLAHVGIDQAAALRACLGTYVVAEAGLRFVAPARLGDALVVESRPSRIRNASSTVHQRVTRDGKVVCEAEIVLAYVGADGRPRRQPARWIDAFRSLAGADLPA